MGFGPDKKDDLKRKDQRINVSVEIHIKSMLLIYCEMVKKPMAYIMMSHGILPTLEIFVSLLDKIVKTEFVTVLDRVIEKIDKKKKNTIMLQHISWIREKAASDEISYKSVQKYIREEYKDLLKADRDKIKNCYLDLINEHDVTDPLQDPDSNNVHENIEQPPDSVVRPDTLLQTREQKFQNAKEIQRALHIIESCKYVVERPLFYYGCYKELDHCESELKELLDQYKYYVKDEEDSNIKEFREYKQYLESQMYGRSLIPSLPLLSLLLRLLWLRLKNDYEENLKLYREEYDEFFLSLRDSCKHYISSDISPKVKKVVEDAYRLVPLVLNERSRQIWDLKLVSYGLHDKIIRIEIKGCQIPEGTKATYAYVDDVEQSIFSCIVKKQPHNDRIVLEMKPMYRDYFYNDGPDKGASKHQIILYFGHTEYSFTFEGEFYYCQQGMEPQRDYVSNIVPQKRTSYGMNGRRRYTW